MKVTKRKAKGVLADMIANMDEESLAKTREKMKGIKIEEDLCSFDVCQKLKEKGFQFKAMIGSMWIDSENKLSMRKDEAIITWDNDFKVPVIPHALAMKWLREVHNICIEPYAAAYRFGFTISKLPTGSNICNDDVIERELVTYSEAIEAALNYALKNLI